MIRGIDTDGDGIIDSGIHTPRTEKFDVTVMMTVALSPIVTVMGSAILWTAAR